MKKITKDILKPLVESAKMPEKYQELSNKIEELGWNMTAIDNEYLEFSKYSDAGEDFFFDIPMGSFDELKNEIANYANSFDPVEHAEEMNGAPGAPDLRTLLKDADSIKKDLEELSSTISSFKNLTESVDDLDDTAMWVYKYTNRDSEWDKFTDDELVKLISYCCLTDKNPYGRAYDDEVFDAADRRPNGEELVKRGQELATGKSTGINEGVETKAGNDFDEVASYMYNEANGYIDDIPTFEATNDYIANVTKSEYNKLYTVVKQAIENVSDHLYNGMIELSDRATINSLYGDTVNDVDPDEAMMVFGNLRDEAFKKFEDETKVGIWQDGRSGRHIVVEDDYYNARDYNKLCEIQAKWEDWVIEEFAKKYSSNSINESTGDVAIDNDPDLNAEQVQADVDHWTEVDEANTEDVSGREPIGVYTLSNTGAIFVYDIEYDINDRVLVGDSSDTTKAKWVNINYDDLEDEELGETIPFFYYGELKVPMNEVMKTNI